jgi:hypothetical protein
VRNVPAEGESHALTLFEETSGLRWNVVTPMKLAVKLLCARLYASRASSSNAENLDTKLRLMSRTWGSCTSAGG